jgi:putative tricarboxylic transport membrane protein
MFGMFVGAMPGLTATMATALLVPGHLLHAAGAGAGRHRHRDRHGDLRRRHPGGDAAHARHAGLGRLCRRSYEMTKKGQLNLNLGVNLVFSALGGLIGVAVLIVLAAPALAEVAINFSSFEYFWLACLGLTCAVFLATPIR